MDLVNVDNMEPELLSLFREVQHFSLSQSVMEKLPGVSNAEIRRR